MRRALGVVDLGSNTVRLAIYVVAPGGGYHLATERRSMLRLGARGERLGEQAYERTAAVLKRFHALCVQYGTAEIVAVATAAVRGAEDGPEFVRRLRAETGVPVRILDGRDEAEAGLLGAVNTLAVDRGVLADVGGGSTEVTLFRDRRPMRVASLPAGAVNLTAGWLKDDPPGAGQLERLRRHVASLWPNDGWEVPDRGDPLVGIGGTFRALGRIGRRHLGLGLRPPLHGTELPADLPEKLLGELVRLSQPERASLPGVPKHRADVILAGLAVIAELVERARAGRIVICGHGLRDGLFFRWLRGGDAVAPDVLAESVANCMALFGVERRRSDRVAGLALALFDGLQPVHGLGPGGRAALGVGAALRESGAYVDYYRRAKHAFYLVRRAPIFGLAPGERELAAAAAAYEEFGEHRERWEGSKNAPDELMTAARLGWMAAMADVLADLPGEDVSLEVSLATTLATIRLRGCGEAAAGCAAHLAEDFRRLFGRPFVLQHEPA